MAEHTDPRPEDIVVQLLRVLSEVDIETLGDDLRRVDTATTRRAMTGASLLAEALTRATFASTTLADALGVELDEPIEHVPHRERGQRIRIHDDEAAAAVTDTDIASEA